MKPRLESSPPGEFARRFLKREFLRRFLSIVFLKKPTQHSKAMTRLIGKELTGHNEAAHGKESGRLRSQVTFARSSG